MTFRESETAELKSIVTEDIKKEVIAFANCNGGKIYVGVSDSGSVIGVENVDESIQQISNMVRDAVKPDVTMFVHYDTIERDGKQIIIVDIQRGTSRPYYLAKKGLRPEGVYVRQGNSSVPATDTAIRLMIKETDGDSFEEMRSLNQDLTFTVATKEFEVRSLAFSQPQKQTLKLLTADGVYTNLGLLMSEQCVHTIKVAVFEGTDQNVFKDRREFTGSLIQQLNDVYNYIDIYNSTRATFDRLLRIDQRSYPDVAVREALLNLLVHRDYAFRASALIGIYADRIEFVSIGGLLPGITLNDILMGVSVCRNANLANVFYRLQLIEAYGTGMQKIMAAYKDKNRKPQIEISDNAFKIILPNLNTHSTAEPQTMNVDETKVLDFAQEHGYITRTDVEALLDVGRSTAVRLLRRMTESGFLTQSGNGKNTKYIIKAK